MSYIETHSGIPFEPLAPRVEDIRIEDIAHALSQQCRFSGHTRVFYSVAEHCVRVSRCLDARGYARSVVLWGLLHDASEAYLVDIPKPLKEADTFAGYRKAETAMMETVCRAFDLHMEEPRGVRIADAVLLATEARDLMPFRPEHWGALKEAPLPERITPWSPAEAERCFLLRFTSLYGRS